MFSGHKMVYRTVAGDIKVLADYSCTRLQGGLQYVRCQVTGQVGSSGFRRWEITFLNETWLFPRGSERWR